MYAGMCVTSKIHKTEHQFAILEGRCRVFNVESGETIELAAGHVGITKPGTRRVLVILEDCRWLTFHPTNLTDLRDIERELIEPHDIPTRTVIAE